MHLAQFSQWLPFLLFAFVASITPGPTNLLVFSNSARFGWSAALPIMLGGCGAAAAPQRRWCWRWAAGWAKYWPACHGCNRR